MGLHRHIQFCITGYLSVRSVTLYMSVWFCKGKGWFADVLEAAELRVNTSIPAETQALFEEAESMREKWEAKHKVHEDDVARKAQEEAAAHEAEEAVCEVEEAAQAEDEEGVKVVDPPKDKAAPACEEEEESRELMPMTKLVVKPAAPKRLEFWALRAMSMASPSVHGSVHTMEVVISVKRKVSGSIPGWQVLTGLAAHHPGRGR